MQLLCSASRPHVTPSEYTVDLLHALANCSGLDLIFGLNALLRTADNTWNSSNARSLLQYCEGQRYEMSWELGNGTSPHPEVFLLPCGDVTQLRKSFCRFTFPLFPKSVFLLAGCSLWNRNKPFSLQSPTAMRRKRGSAWTDISSGRISPSSGRFCPNPDFIATPACTDQTSASHGSTGQTSWGGQVSLCAYDH